MIDSTLAVILDKPEHLDWVKMAQSIAAVKKIPQQDALHEAKRGWGVIAENVDAATAEQLTAALEKNGLGAKTIPAEKIPKPKAPHLIQKMDILDGGWEIEVKPGDRRVIPWNLIALFAASTTSQTTTRTTTITTGPSAGEQLAKFGIMMATGIPIPMKKKKTEIVKTTEKDLLFHLDIFLTSPFLRLRLEPATIDYSFLREQKEMSALVNFRRMFEDMTTRAPKALLNHGARVLKNREPVSKMGYGSESDLEKECRWLLALLSA